MTTQLNRYSLSELQQHPWQVNIPDITGKEWTEFLADIRERGVQDPITVSMRTGVPVIVDGHQRVRAARECGYDSVEALEKPFADEGEEIITLANSARLRRQLTDGQRVAIGKALKVEFAKEAAQNVGGRPPKQQRVEGEQVIFEEEKPNSNLNEVSANDKATTARVAKAVGMSTGQFHKAEKVYDTAPAPVKNAWMQGEVSTHAAHTLTKSPEPIQQALNEGKVNIPQAIALEKNKDIRKQVEDGTVTVEEGVKLSDALQREHERVNRETQREQAIEVGTAYQAIIDLGVKGLRAGHDSRYNQEHLKNQLGKDYLEVMSILHQLYDGHNDKEITVKAITLN